MKPPLCRLALLLLLAPALGGASPSPGAAEQAAARALGEPARFREVRARGDVVCGEVAASAHAWRPFRAYVQSHAWSVQTSTDGLSLGEGLACFDREVGAGRRGAGGPVCRGYDFAFYFAWDHFCR